MVNTEITLAKFEYNPNSLSVGSNKSIVVNCDYCGSEYITTNKRYRIARKKFEKIGLVKDCCKNCKQLKTKEAYSLQGKNYEETMSESNKRGHANRSAEDKAEIIAKVKKTWAIKTGEELAAIVAKREATAEEKYGSVDNYRQKVQSALKATMLAKYGVENPSQLPEIQQKRLSTFREKYGVDYPSQLPEVKDKIAQTNKSKYGGLSMNRPEEKARHIAEYKRNIKAIRQKIVQTNLERYGEEYYTQTARGKHAAKRTRIQNHHQYELDGKTTDIIAEETGFSRVYINFLLRNGHDPRNLTKSFTHIEAIVKSILDKNRLDYTSHQNIFGRKSDFLISGKVVIEADGLYFHSEANGKPKRYHQIKRKHYIENGYIPLFFRANEICDKPEIVESIILNKLGKSNRVFARKCKILRVDRNAGIDFLDRNHLMGAGRGDIFGLFYKSELVSVIQIRNTNQHKGIYEISRFCHRNSCNVVGGFSKLVRYIEGLYKMQSLVTYIDLRYGGGAYLESLGFSYSGEYLSFAWTDGRKAFHRMRYRGNTGYDHNLTKIWDCGQAKYVKHYHAT